MELKKLICTVNEDGIAVITMNYMKNLNAIDEQMADELMYIVDAAEKDSNVKVVVLKGTDRAFSAGGDIGYFYGLIQAGGEVNMDGLISKVGVVADGLKRMSKMVITSVCGATAGTGVSLALGGDFVIAEVEEIVEVGELGPEEIHVPAPIVDMVYVRTGEKRPLCPMWQRAKLRQKPKQKKRQKEGISNGRINRTRTHCIPLREIL